ncbi:hypothetical protein DC31_13775 [Microbacterium sp. CH12i]|uniref:hypothetical protein n=1 Tax=Microbacterium sp. CH12i TaxID=1479651 RepID=UPI0004610A3D|nr:hypothetical protein [Microbacterium sp. CH12i]KDA05849.1 hypothetical protein DC31_13775 [Microbacterium sp. CH12i]
MTKVSTKSVQRKISAEDLQFLGYLRAPMAAKPTALGLWVHTDGLGRREMVPELIAAAIYPGEAATDLVIEHLLMLDESGFLELYQDDEGEWIALSRPLKLDARLARSDCPAPPSRARSRSFAAVGGARERAGARVRAEQGERAGQWATWADEQEQAPRLRHDRCCWMLPPSDARITRTAGSPTVVPAALPGNVTIAGSRRPDTASR